MKRMKGSVYMRWAKEHAAARYNLANSGLLGCTFDELGADPGDLRLNGAYPDGLPALREAIAERYGIASEQQVVLAQGTSGANFLALATLVEPGEEVLVEVPTYEPILAALAFLGARARRFARRPEDGWRPDLDELGQGLAAGARLVVLTDPHNPTGVALSPADLGEIARRTGDAGAHLLVDEVYRDLCLEDAEASSSSNVHLGPHVLATSSLTKSYGLSGLRCGWILAPADLADRLRRANDFMGASGPLPTEALATAAFRHLPRLAARARAIVDPNQPLIHAFLADHAEHLDCVIPPRSLVVFPRLRNEADAWPLHERLRRLETSIVPGAFFEMPQHFRLGFAIRTEDVATGLGNLSLALRG